MDGNKYLEIMGTFNYEYRKLRENALDASLDSNFRTTEVTDRLVKFFSEIDSSINIELKEAVKIMKTDEI